MDRLWLPATKLHEMVVHIARQHTDRSSLALAVFFGCVIGLLPLYGTHLVLCIAVASLFRLNQVITYLAAHISLPPLIPVWLFLSYQVGYFFFYREFASISFEEIGERGADNFSFLFCGSLFVGVAIGAVLGSVVYFFPVRFFRSIARTTAWSAKCGELFFVLRALHGKFFAYRICGKLRFDPVYQQVAARLPAEAKTLLDVGGGEGLVSWLFTFGDASRKALLLDWDERKLKVSKQIARAFTLNMEARSADLGHYHGTHQVDCVTAIDVLHYFSFAQQKRLLLEFDSFLTDHGTLLIRDMDRDRRLRTWLTTLQERVSLNLGLTKAQRIFPPSASETEIFLNGLGYQVETLPSWGWVPFANVLMIAKKVDRK